MLPARASIPSLSPLSNLVTARRSKTATPADRQHVLARLHGASLLPWRPGGVNLDPAFKPLTRQEGGVLAGGGGTLGPWAIQGLLGRSVHGGRL